MNAAQFLRELRDLLRTPSTWHAHGAINARGRLLGRYEQCVPGDGRLWGDHGPRNWAPTDSTPVAWNLPDAIHYLLKRWEQEGHFLDAPIESQALLVAVTSLLLVAADVVDLELVTEHGDAIAAIDGVLASFGQKGRAA